MKEYHNSPWNKKRSAMTQNSMKAQLTVISIAVIGVFIGSLDPCHAEDYNILPLQLLYIF
jgi:hypothetical protein